MDDVRKFEHIGGLGETPDWGFRHDRQIAPELVDRNNHLNYLGFARIFEEAQVAFHASRGVAYEDLQRVGITLVVKELKIEYEKEVGPDEQVTVFTKSFPGNSSIPIHQAMLNGENQLVAKATFSLVAVGPDGNPVVLPADIRGKLSSLEAV